VNQHVEGKNGKIAGTYVKTIGSLPGRVYTTIILAVNENTFENLRSFDSQARRKSIKKSLELLGNDPSVINLARLANIFGVSRTMIYKDLEVLGYKRS
jgi:hypothetical protein